MSDQNSFSNHAVLVANELLATCAAAASSEPTDADLESFSRDKAFLEKAISAFAAGDPEAINLVWRDVQHLSRFFGGDYVMHSNGSEDFERQCDELFDATLELVSSFRAR
jgi:hypothetical protein